MNKILSVLALLFFSAVMFAQEKPETYFMEGLKLANESKYDEAIEKLKKAIELKPKYAESHLHLSVVYANKKNYDAAIKEVELAIADKANSVTAHFLYAVLCEKKQLNAKAVEEWQKILDLRPKPEMKELAEKHLKKLKGK